MIESLFDDRFSSETVGLGSRSQFCESCQTEYDPDPFQPEACSLCDHINREFDGE